MKRTPKDAGERLANLANALAVSVANASDEELLEDARLYGGDPEKMRKELNQILQDIKRALAAKGQDG